MDNFREILEKLGYSQITDSGQYYRMPARYRDGDNPTSLSVNKRTGNFVDFVAQKTGNFEQLVGLSLNITDINKVKDYLKNEYEFEFVAPEQTIKLEVPEIFDNSILNDLVKDYSYWNNRGISNKTLEPFRGGVMKEGKLKDRFVFPIFNAKNQINGFSGRDITGKKQIRWKHAGKVSNFKYPLFLNHKLIKEKKEAILVESIGDVLSLWESGIYNVICVFGVNLSLTLLNLLIKFDINKIIISLNNDSNKNNVGNNAAEKLQNKLLRYFDARQIEIKLPPMKDWNEVLLKNKELIKF